MNPGAVTAWTGQTWEWGVGEVATVEYHVLGQNWLLSDLCTAASRSEQNGHNISPDVLRPPPP